MVDAVGGIDVGIDAPTSTTGVIFHAGINHLDGFEALAYVRQRDGLAGGDLDRAQRQQNALRAFVTRIAEQDTLSNPVGTFELLDATSRSVSVDDTLSNGGLRRLASTLNDSRRPTSPSSRRRLPSSNGKVRARWCSSTPTGPPSCGPRCRTTV